jgi:hypothetical protein
MSGSRTAPLLPANTGTEFQYRIAYFKYSGLVRVRNGQVPWDNLVGGSLKASQAIDLPQNYDLSSYTPLDSPNRVREMVTGRLSRPQRCCFLSKSDWEGDWLVFWINVCRFLC